MIISPQGAELLILKRPPRREGAKAYLVGGGSLDGAGNAVDGYVVRGGRMLESKYLPVRSS